MEVSCPRCKKITVYSDQNPFRPFCSERCKLIDLGDWASEKFRIEDKSTKPELDTEDDSEKS